MLPSSDRNTNQPHLDEAYKRNKAEGRLRTLSDLYHGIHEGAVLRVRPIVMTVATTIIGLLPVMIGNVFEPGSQVMQRIAAPMVGGLISATILTLLIIPAIYMLWRSFGLRREIRRGFPVVPHPASQASAEENA